MLTSTASSEVVVPLRRTTRSAWTPDQLDGVYSEKVRTNHRLLQAARPVLDRLVQDLQGVAVGVFVINGQGEIMERVVQHTRFAGALDFVSMAPGHRWTSAEGFSCSVAPLLDPNGGRRLGTLCTVCRDVDANLLMQPYTELASREIAARLVDDASAAERMLLEHFVRVRRKSRGPVIAINERKMLTNAAAARFVADDDHAVLWEWAERAMADRGAIGGRIDLVSGETVTARCEPALASGELVGALIRLEHGRRERRAPAGRKGPAAQPRFGWESLSSGELGVAKLVAAGLTNQEVGARLFLSRHTIDFHLRQIFNKLDVRSRVELTRIVVQTYAAEGQSPAPLGMAG